VDSTAAAAEIRKGRGAVLMLRCHAKIPIGKSGLVETYCYEPVDDAGKCSIHGQVYDVIPKRGLPEIPKVES
jgi:hypothetical protein